MQSADHLKKRLPTTPSKQQNVLSLFSFGLSALPIVNKCWLYFKVQQAQWNQDIKIAISTSKY